ncbi:MAG: ImmA/IrrE family metallo-endopeptidase [Chitinophaga sp.]|nr:ImmA/IrrE family metallo-endopeptidase [Chitinophaga sp.]
MAPKKILKRGFPAQAEQLAIEYRDKLKLHACAPICAFKLAEHLRIPIYSATEFLTLQHERDHLSGTNGSDCGWSALTMTTGAGNRIIIHNPFHSAPRQQSNIMHELAHIICGHEVDEAIRDIPLPFGMRHFDEVQEEEAKCLGATLQLPKPGLLWSLKRSMSQSDIATHFNASVEMVAYRLNISGAAKQSYYMRRR